MLLRNETATYGELEESSGRLANLLREAGCARGDRVCLFAPKSPGTVMAMHAVLKAGCSYVPIDLSSPPIRSEKIVRAVEPTIGLVTGAAASLIDSLHELGLALRVVSIERPLEGERFRSEFARDDLVAFPSERPAIRARSGDLAHILFTSGSTGMPKGVAITHANVANFVEWAHSYFGIATDDRLSGHPPFHFDLSTFDIYSTFSAAAQLHLIPPELNLIPPKLASFVRGARLTQWFSVPSVMTLLAKFDAISPGSLPDLRRVLWCGEVIPTSTLIYWMERVPQAKFTNLYGPTEATIASSYHTLTQSPADAHEAIPIGRSCPGEELLVLDSDLRPAPPGVVGHLYIAGGGLSPGYWGDEEKTREAFVPDPRPGRRGRIYRTGDLARTSPDGLVWFLGRQDSQIKTRGYRVELGEIEAALAGLESLKEFAVVGVESEAIDGTAICCAYARVDGALAETAALKDALRHVLPGYMLPTRWLELPTLPRNANDKIDRARIRELFAESLVA